MAHSIWDDLCNQPTQAVSTEKYAKLVYDSTTQLHQPIQLILSTLDRRAMALTKLANFESALRDAQVMQQISPSSALGYLREADIYSEQGRQHHVIDVCSKGLSMIDTMDTHYDTLQRAKMEAEQRQNTRIDFVTQLPMDIVSTKLVPLFMNVVPLDPFKPTPYIHVSHAWRDRIVESFNGLRVRVNEHDSIFYVIQLARHIKRLEITYATEQAWLCALLRNNDFCSLKEVSIEGSTDDYVDDLVASLKSISSTLTRFEMEQYGDAMLPIADILDNCPNMAYLDITHPYVGDITSLPMPTLPQLTTLVLFSNAQNMITSDHIKAIGARFPSLKKLQYYPCEDMESTRGIMEYYPRMNSLDLRKDGGAFNVAYYEQEPVRKETGVTYIDIEVNHLDDDPWEDVIYILMQHHETVQCMNFNVDVADEPEEIYKIELPNLKRLCLLNSGWWIPRNAPMLEELKLSYHTQEVSAVPDTASPHLKTLKVEMERVLHLGDSPRLERYLYQLSQHSQLKDLHIDFRRPNPVDSVQNAILRLHCLERLVIQYPGDWDTTSMQSFLVELTKRCPNLSCLGISCNNAPSTCSINALKKLAHLERLGFSIQSMGDDDAFWQAIETFSQLSCIYIFPANPPNMERLRCLMEKRSDLKLIVNEWLTEI